MSDSESKLAVGVVGHRSFIAQALLRELLRREFLAVTLDKASLRDGDLSHLDCLYLVLGRERPSADEARVELEQVRAYVANPLRCRRTVYVSSRLDMPHKREAEDLMLDSGGVALRPPAVFGPNQRADSAMLIPSLVRSGGREPLRNPDEPGDFISASTLATELVGLMDPWVGSRHVLSLRGSFRMTPRQVRDLYDAFRGFEFRPNRSD